MSLLLKNLHPTYLGLRTFCSTCHADPHEGRLKQSCSSCHDPAGWKPAKNFDHASTHFPLQGKHGAVACAKCHPGVTALGVPNGKAGLAPMNVRFATSTFTDCTPCHTTPHTSTFSNQKCASCHVPEGWKIAKTNKSFDHSLTVFPLLGRHAEVKCVQCHERNISGAQSFHIRFAACSDCHVDKHNGEFRKTFGNNCAVCHTVQGYKPSTFTIASHAKGRFPLAGSHIAIACAKCHYDSSRKKLYFHVDDLRCQTCHTDPHNGKFSGVMKRAGCEACHNTEQWTAVSFDHSTTPFPLAGKHGQVPCGKCHNDTDSTIRSTAKSATDCSSCHKDIHLKQFAVNDSTNCANCHASTGWKDVNFNHETQSRFSLTGAHQRVQCAVCHLREGIGESSFIRFKPIETRCESCHTKKKG